MPRPVFDDLQKLLLKQVEAYSAKEEAYEKLQQEKPKKVGFIEWLTFQSKAIKEANKVLLEKQLTTARPGKLQRIRSAKAYWHDQCFSSIFLGLVIWK